MAIGIPAHRCVLSIFPIKMTHDWRHNGITHYEHAAAPRDKILVRTFAWNIGVHCTDHPNHEQDNRALQSGRCQYQIDNRNRCGLDLVERPRWTDVFTDCEKDKGYAIYVLHDTRSWNRDWSQDKEVFRADPVDAQSIVNDFCAIYGQGLLGSNLGLRPGILPLQGDVPTDEELQRAIDQQNAHFEFLFHDAVALHVDGKTKEITNLHRVACTWLGRNDLPFLKKIGQRSIKACPACAEDIMDSALKCRHCGESLPDFYQRYGLSPEVNGDVVVTAFMSKMPIKPGVSRFKSKAELVALGMANVPASPTPPIVEPPVKAETPQPAAV